MIGLPAGFGIWLGQALMYGDGEDLFTRDTTRIWNQALSEQQKELESSTQHSQEQLAALTLRMAELQARLFRLDALGERLTTIAKLDEGEFDFSQPPALGGPESAALGDAYLAPEFMQVVDRLAASVESREQLLDFL
jgi:hypothetical protein